MRTSSLFRMLVLAAALSAPLAQIASADQSQQPQQQQQQQAMSPNANSGAGSFGDGGPYSSDATLSPAVGD